MHLGCRSVAAAEGWSGRSRRGSIGALGVALSEQELSGGKTGGSLFGAVLIFHLYWEFFGIYRNTIQCVFFSSYPQQRRRFPELHPPPQNNSEIRLGLSASLPLSESACCCRVFKGWALSLCFFLLRLSLLVTPPCVPTPHLSVSQ